MTSSYSRPGKVGERLVNVVNVLRGVGVSENARGGLAKL